jgi:hypothetical protein
MDTLHQKIIELISDDNYDTSDLKSLLNPISQYIDNPRFFSQLKKLTNIITEDRNGDNKFTVSDLTLLSKDVIAITSLTTGLILLMGTVSDTKLQYDSSATEEIVLKLLFYLFLVVIPEETDTNLSLTQKGELVLIVLSMYELFKQTAATQALLENMTNWVKTISCCSCFRKKQNKEELIEEQMEQIEKDLKQRLHSSTK